MPIRCAASVCGGSLLPVYYFTVCMVGPRRENARRLIKKHPVSRWRTILFEARAYISYNLKFVY
jgi:hypothetical protein